MMYGTVIRTVVLNLKDTLNNELPISNIEKGLKEVEEKDIAMIVFYKRGEKDV